MKVGQSMNTDVIGDLLQKVNSLADVAARDAALTLLLATLEFHREGLERMMEIVADSGARSALAADPLVSSLLLWHDLHPLDVETRIARALNRPEIRALAGEVQLLSIRDGIVRVRIEGGPEFSSAVQAAIFEAAPDLARLQIESPDAYTLIPKALVN
jgi:hypothetical protein